MIVRGVTRQIDAHGRVCIPKDYLKKLGIKAGEDPVEIKFIVDEDGNKKIEITEDEEHVEIKRFFSAVEYAKEV